jgi:N-methylhydantoinase B
MTTHRSGDVDPTTLEILRNQFSNISEEIQGRVMRSAYSPLWQDASDLSAAILSPDGEIVGQSRRAVPIHVGTMIRSVRTAVDDVGGRESLVPGDMLIQNDPYSGNNHLPDFLLTKPVFKDDDLVGFSAIRCHWLDVGGSSATSYATDTGEIIKEGIRVPPAKLFRGGERNEGLFNTIIANVRNRDERLGDFNAQLGGAKHGAQRLLEIADEHGAQTVRTSTDQLLTNDEILARNRIAELPDGTYKAEDYLDGDGITDAIITIEAALEVDGEELHVDFSGTDDEADGGVNAPLAVTEAATYAAIKNVLNPGQLNTSGEYRPIEVTAPKGSLLNPEYPAPVVAGNHETAFRVFDTVVKAFGNIDPELIFGCGEGSTNGLGYRSLKAKHGTGRANRTRAIGGMGACPSQDGPNAIRSGIGNAGVEPVERVEQKYDYVTIDEWSIMPGTGGAGRYRGGNGARMAMEFENDVELVLTGERAKTQPYGVDGGKPGSAAKYIHIAPDGERTELGSKAVTNLEAGSTYIVEPSGGGGFGDPEERPAEAVRDDVVDGDLTVEQARDEYNVAIGRESHEIDRETTQELRDGD